MCFLQSVSRGGANPFVSHMIFAPQKNRISSDKDCSGEGESMKTVTAAIFKKLPGDVC